ncbi:MAG: hypothetical protein NZ528_05505 [Caldilineales bacterium]|nr:hypothetical protein [Caldilineales bacterium]MDW8317845.1 hypothetical protein [Anaerolineae bacterium]
MPVLDLSPQLLERVEQAAQWQHATAAEVAERALADYLDRLEWEKLEAEMAAFQAQLPSLLPAYPDEFVAIHEGQVIDHDKDLRALHQRVYNRMRSVPVLLQKVTAVPSADVLVRGPRVEE